MSFLVFIKWSVKNQLSKSTQEQKFDELYSKKMQLDDKIHFCLNHSYYLREINNMSNTDDLESTWASG